MRYIIFVIIVMAITGQSFAGGSSGTSTPPGREKLTQELMMAEPGKAGVFDTGAGDIGLLAKSELLSTLTVSKSSLQSRSNSTGDLAVSDEDFSLLSAITKPLYAVSINGGNASYRIEAADTLNQVILKDRREIMRLMVK